MTIKTGTRQLGLQSTAKISPKSKGAPRTMRCRGCGGQATEVADDKGGTILRCRNCRREFSFRSM